MTDSSNPRRQNEVVASACGLTGARYGVIATVDEAGAPQDFVFSGVTPEEQQELLAWPGSGRLIQHLRELPGPLRVADLSAYTRSLGIEPAQTFSRTFQGMPMRHRGGDVGNFFLAEKADGEEFSDDDEEVLVLLASQAAAAVANARTYRGERQARVPIFVGVMKSRLCSRMSSTALPKTRLPSGGISKADPESNRSRTAAPSWP